MTALVVFILLLFSFLRSIEKKRLNWIIIVFFLGYLFLGFLFIKFQDEPLITPLLISIIIAVTFILARQIYFGEISGPYCFVYITLIASVISIALLNYFNLELEKNSLRTTALEINRPNDNLLRFLLKETLKNASENEELISDFYKSNSNFTADAFKLWANSSLQRESLNSSLNIWDREQNLLGGFNSGIDLGTKTAGIIY